MCVSIIVSNGGCELENAALEKEFIRPLSEQGYTYLSIHSEAELISNLRERLEELNKYKFIENYRNKGIATELVTELLKQIHAYFLESNETGNKRTYPPIFI